MTARFRVVPAAVQGDLGPRRATHFKRRILRQCTVQGVRSRFDRIHRSHRVVGGQSPLGIRVA